MLLGVVASAILLLVGGAIGDLRRARPLIVGGLATLVVTGTVGLLIPEGPVFIAARLIGAAASALTVPAALASVALAYRGVARATALGIAYAVVFRRPRGHADPAHLHPRRPVAGIRRRADRGPDRPVRGSRPDPGPRATRAPRAALRPRDGPVGERGRGDLGRRPVAGHRLGAPPALGDHRLRRRAAGRLPGVGAPASGHPPGGPAGRPAARDRRPVRRRRDRARPVGPDAHPAAILRDRAALRPRVRDAGHRAADRRAGRRRPGRRVPARALPAAGARRRQAWSPSASATSRSR